MLKDTDECPICNSAGWFILPELGVPVDCICKTLFYEHSQYAPILRMYGSKYRRGKKLTDLQMHGSNEARAKIKDLVTSFSMWLDFPRGWAILYGKPGSGKSHILEALAWALFPIALYISAEEFNTKIRQHVGTKTLDDLIDEVKGIPVLLFDDWGTGFDSDFTQSTLRAIMQHRYNRSEELPTILTTNMDKATINVLDPRLMDRLFEAGKWVDMTMIPSYRRHK